jgi:hypothetical protein
VGEEKIGLMNDTFYLEQRKHEEKMSFTITEITAQSNSKNDRIRDILVPQYARGQWLWPEKLEKFSTFDNKNVDLVAALRLEFLQFPNGVHDDMLDTHTFLAHMSLIKPKEPEKKVDQGLTFGDYVKMTEERRNKVGDPWENMKFPSRV